MKNAYGHGLLLVLFGIALALGQEDPINIPDIALKGAIETELWVSDPTPSDMLGLVELKCIELGIKDLTGLEYANNLTDLSIRLNQVSDISPLTGCSQLETLDLSKNQYISDLTPLADLVHLKVLDCHVNHISDLSFAKKLGNLEVLVLRRNRVGDISKLSHLTKLKRLSLEYNTIEDLSPLAGMANLYELIIWGNRIVDISALSSLTAMQELSIGYNQIQDVTALACMKKLSTLSLINNDIKDISPLKSLTTLHYLRLRGNPLNNQAYEQDLFEISRHNTFLAGLDYDANPRGPEGLRGHIDTVSGVIKLSWSTVANGPSYRSYYRVYRSGSLAQEPVAISLWQSDTSFVDSAAQPGGSYYYWVQCAVSTTGDEAGTMSSALKMTLSPCLSIESGFGGTVVSPTPGLYSYEKPARVALTASPVDPCLFEFTSWSGSAVDAGKVIDAHQMNTEVWVDGIYTVRANFISTQSRLFVDANAVGSSEYGTQVDPFYRIQDAIEMAQPQSTICVMPEHYEECLDLQGKSLTLLGLDPCSLEPSSLPVIDANGMGPCLVLDSNSLIQGFALTGGTSAIECNQCEATISHCLLVGHRIEDANIGVIDCVDSKVVFVQCTMAGNIGPVISLHDSRLEIDNSIIWDASLDQLILDDRSVLDQYYSDSSYAWWGAGDFSEAPLFYRPGYWEDLDGSELIWHGGDYHLQSEYGRWNEESGLWEFDSQTSPCVGIGAMDIWLEKGWFSGLNPLNCGVYGGTPMASKTPE